MRPATAAVTKATVFVNCVPNSKPESGDSLELVRDFENNPICSISLNEDKNFSSVSTAKLASRPRL